jgi:hypothetical protein
VVFALFFGLTGMSEESRSMKLIDDGRAVALIVIPETSSVVVSQAVVELNQFLLKTSGCELPVIREPQYKHKKKQVAIYVGQTEAALAAGIDLRGLTQENLRVKFSGNQIFVLGKDICSEPFRQRKASSDDGKCYLGTYDAMIWFIENSLGGGFLFPGEYGTSYPYGKTVCAKITDKDYSPKYIIRSLRNFCTSGEFEKAAKKLLSPEWMNQRKAETSEWLLRRGTGHPNQMGSGHAFMQWYEKYGKSDPDIFAKFPDGNSGIVTKAKTLQHNDPTYLKFCESNPKVLAFTIEQMDEFFLNSPHSLTFCVAQNDGRYDGFCMCDHCKKMDDTTTDKIAVRYANRDGSLYKTNYFRLTDRYAKSWNKISAAMADKYPGKYLVAYAYGAMDRPPKSTPLPKNMIIQFCPTIEMWNGKTNWLESIGVWDEWKRTGARLIYRPNLHHGGGFLPIVYTKKLDHEIKHFDQHGMIGCDYDELYASSSGTQGINNYVLARLVFDPGLTEEQLVREFCQKAYGPAAQVMLSYYSMLEKITDDMIETRQATWGKSFADTIATGETAQKINGLFDEALKLTQTDPDCQKRIELARQGYRYAELFAKLEGPSGVQANKDLLEFLQANKKGYVVDYVSLNIRRGLIWGLKQNDLNLKGRLAMMCYQKPSEQAWY